MDDDQNPDRRMSEPPTNMSADGSPTRDEVHPDGAGEAPASPAQHIDPAALQRVEEVKNSEIGISTLLNRLKQSVASAKEFAAFLKQRSKLEEEHANGIRKMTKSTYDSVRRPDHRGGTFATSFDDFARIHERMADNGAQFSASLQQMHEDMIQMAATVERGRKQWKQTGLTAEQRVKDLEAAMHKSKAKYDSLADDYDRARTGERAKKFGLKGPKSAAQHEEDLQRKVAAADMDYSNKVHIARTAREELLSRERPEAVTHLEALIRECDAALTLQMQKFATFNEKLLLSNGISVSPISVQVSDRGSSHKSLRDAVYAIDNEKDLRDYLVEHASKVPPKPAEIKYEKNPVLMPSGGAPPVQLPPQRQQEPVSSYPTRNGPPQPAPAPASYHHQHSSVSYGSGPPQMPQHDRSFSQGHPLGGYEGVSPVGPPSHPQHNGNTFSSNGAPALPSLSFQSPTVPTLNEPPRHTPPPSGSSNSYAAAPSNAVGNLPPKNPVFGISLEELFQRDGSAVPMVVYQCIQAVDLFGLEVEGIYRLSGTASHITRMKSQFDHDASAVDFRDPESFYHDVNSVAGLLKQFFRELPDPLLTSAQYAQFIDAGRLDDDTVRRDSLHALINSLPDANYATLRAITLHLNRVQEHSKSNRMPASNLAVVFGPTLMGSQMSSDIQEAPWQSKVIETILLNTYQIFDDD